MTTQMETIDSLLVGETEGSYSLVISPHATLSFDRSGRPTGVYENGMYVARGMDGRCLEKKWVWSGKEEPRRHIRELSSIEQDSLRDNLLLWIARCQTALPGLARRSALRSFAGGRETAPILPDLSNFLDFLARGVEKAWAADPDQFSQVWRPIGILPPDQYLALVLQVTEGCAWNQCTFCTFYKAEPARLRSLDEIHRHVEDVERFLGPAMSGRCSIFLGSANAFEAPPDLLIPLVKELSVRFPRLAVPQTDGIGGIYSFAESTRMSSWTPADLQALSQAGYRRATLGVETGSDSLRRTLKKPGSSDTVAKTILKLKSAGISVGVIVLLGAGGKKNAGSHVRGTVDLLSDVPLGPGDFLYFSPLRIASESSYAMTSHLNHWDPLSESELVSQRKEIESALPSRGERRALYDIREFIY